MKGSIPCVIRWGRREILELDVCGTKVCEEEKSTVLCGRDEAAVCVFPAYAWCACRGKPYVAFGDVVPQN